tara:strand:+ start:2251 stop:2691 length:441 start_codon:yes stop_codon:yes gene_type:complete
MLFSLKIVNYKKFRRINPMTKQIITPLPEVIDRYTISLLKLERLDDSEIDIDEMKEQVEYYKSGIDFDSEGIVELSDKLYEVNGKIWDVEGSIREGLDSQLGYEEIGKRAIMVRDLNRERMIVKNDIIELTGDGFKDCKMNCIAAG